MGTSGARRCHRRVRRLFRSRWTAIDVVEWAGIGAMLGFIGAAVLYSAMHVPQPLEPWQSTNTKLLEAYALLRSTEVGRELVLDPGKGTLAVEFAPIRTSTVASYLGGESEVIRINSRLQNDISATPTYIAGVLAHEFTHARRAELRIRNSLDEELEAAINEVLVWRELSANKPFSRDFPGNYLLRAFNGGKQAMMNNVKRRYSKLRWIDRRQPTPKRKKYISQLDTLYAGLWQGKNGHPIVVEPPLVGLDTMADLEYWTRNE